MRIALVCATLALATSLAADTVCGVNAPCYPPEGIVNAASSAQGQFAPYTWLSLYGTNLAYTTRARPSSADVQPDFAGVTVLVNNQPAYISYVSPGQVNFLVPLRTVPGPTTVQVLRESRFGPLVTVNLNEAAPALFLQNPATAMAVHTSWTVAMQDDPLRPGEWAILYATGLGAFLRPIPDNTAAQSANSIARRSEFTVFLDGRKLDDSAIWYAGAAPNLIGLYQINVQIPQDTLPNPEIRIGLGERFSPSGIRIPVQ